MAGNDPVSPATRHEKLPEPPKFYAMRKKDELTGQEWVAVMREHLLMRDYSLTSAKAVHYAAMFLRGSALTWHMAEGSSVPQKYPEWSEALLAGVAPTPDDEFAVNRMEYIRQTKSMLSYIDEFRKLCLRVPDAKKSRHDKVKCFVNGCAPEVRKLLRPAMVGRSTDDLRTCMQLALQFDNDLAHERLVERRSARPNNVVHHKAASASTSERTRTCFRCGSTDHLIANCPQSPNGDGRHRSKDRRSSSKGKTAVKFKKADVKKTADSDDSSSSGSSNC